VHYFLSHFPATDEINTDEGYGQGSAMGRVTDPPPGSAEPTEGQVMRARCQRRAHQPRRTQLCPPGAPATPKQPSLPLYYKKGTKR